MHFSTRFTSRGRSWTGFDANLFETSGGLAEAPSLLRHSVSMHVGPPLRATCRCDSSISRRLQCPGDIDVVPAGYSGAWEDDGPTTMLEVSVSPSLIETAAAGMGLDSDRVWIRPQLSLRDPHIEHILWALKAELEGEPCGRLYADSLGLALAAQLLRRYACAVPRRIAGGLPKRRLELVKDYVREHIAHDLTLAELAAVAHVSPSHFKLLFKQSVGVPVHQYVIQCRVQYATELVVRGTLPLSDVALAAGFANQSHMARCMRRIIGLTPGALRSAV